MKTVALIEKTEAGKYSIYTPDLDSTIIGLGDSVADAKSDFENSVKEILDSYAGETLPTELQNIEFDYKFDIQSLFDYYSFINVSKFAKRAGINSSLLRQYKSGATRYISDAQADKIQAAFRAIGQEFIDITIK